MNAPGTRRALPGAMAALALVVAWDALAHFVSAHPERAPWPALAARLPWLYLAQYVGTNLALGAWFGLTLRAGRTPLCSRFAARIHGPLSPRLQRYTRRVTLAWTLFFGGSAALSALLFVAAPPALWSLFTNVCYLPSVALMFVAESVARRLALPPHERSGIVDSIRAYRAEQAAEAPARALRP